MTIRHLLQRFRAFLRVSSHFHIKEDGISTPEEFVDLVDRFIDGNYRYPLEWDDFISWENENKNLEDARSEIGKFEPFLFSNNFDEKKKYLKAVLTQRNRMAAMVGLPSRSEIYNGQGVTGRGSRRTGSGLES